MPPYIFKHYHKPKPRRGHYRDDYDYDDYDYDPRYHRYDYSDYKRDDDEDSLYGETVYDLETVYTSPTYNSRRRRHHQHHHHHHQHQQRHHHQHRPSRPHYTPEKPVKNFEHHYPHIHYTSPRSEPPVRYGHTRLPQHMEVAMLRALPEHFSEPRIALYATREKRQQNPHCHCPEKSSKAIPSMYYDELRCPHCAVHVQPAQEEILAYPWTAQSYKPANRAPLSDANISLPPIPPPNGTNQKNKSKVDKPGPTVTSKPEAPQRQQARRASQDKENQSFLAPTSFVAPTQPLFRYNHHVPASSQYATDFSYVRRGDKGASDVTRGDRALARAKGTSLISQTVLSGVRETKNVDDIRPMDSVSNVASLPPLRRQMNEHIRNYDYRPRAAARAETEVDLTYTREKYFQSLQDRQQQQQQQQSHPLEQQRQLLQASQRQFRLAGPMPRPAKDTASQISRMLKGEYYDRVNKQKYAYNINYGPRMLDSDRQPYS